MPTDMLDRWREQDWQLIPPTRLSASENLALDEVLTGRVGRGERKPTIRFWQWAGPAVILGRFQSVQNEIDADAARRNGIEIVRRITGGGTILAQPDDVIMYSIYVPDSFVRGLSFADSYREFDHWVIDALGELGVNAWYEGLNDITSEGGKIGGAAQARRNGAVLHHAAVAYRMDHELMGQVLRIGQEKLSDKGIRSADRRVGPLRQQIDLEREEITQHFIDFFRRQFGLTDDTITPDEQQEMQRLATEKFQTRDWVYFLP